MNDNKKREEGAGSCVVDNLDVDQHLNASTMNVESSSARGSGARSSSGSAGTTYVRASNVMAVEVLRRISIRMSIINCVLRFHTMRGRFHFERLAHAWSHWQRARVGRKGSCMSLTVALCVHERGSITNGMMYHVSLSACHLMAMGRLARIQYLRPGRILVERSVLRESGSS